MQAKWSAEHTAIVEQFKADFKAGKIKEFVLVPKQ